MVFILAIIIAIEFEMMFCDNIVTVIQNKMASLSLFCFPKHWVNLTLNWILLWHYTCIVGIRRDVYFEESNQLNLKYIFTHFVGFDFFIVHQAK